MKLRYLLIALTVFFFSSCKKDNTPQAQPDIFSFDFEGAHHSYTLSQLQLQVIDTGALKGKYLTLSNGNSSLPKVQFTISDRTNNYGATCFSTGPYSALSSNTVCNDSVTSNFCIGFFMQYTDTGVGKVGLFARNDSTSLLNLASCVNGVNGSASVISGTFSCVLTDSTGFISPKHVTNGILSNVGYVKN